MVTNYSKERPGSIVGKTLKNEILTPIDTSKLDFHADFKYISFIKFSPTHQKIRADKTFFLKKGETPLKSNRI